MTAPTPEPQVTVLDTGGQYTHLITRKVRELGVYAEIRASETPASELRQRKAFIISGGPASVYEPGSPTVDPAIFATGAAVLGICYGQQVMAQVLGGVVNKGVKGEYGLAYLDVAKPSPLFAGSAARQRIWMNHRDSVGELPSGFELVASTDSCAIAAIADQDRRLYGVQFHPEVVQTEYGREVLSNFLFGIAGCRKDWNPKHRVPLIEERIREVAADRNVFFFVSGGVDSTVAYTLCLRSLGADRVRGLYVDTGLMREGETDYVRALFASLGATGFSVEDARAQFLGKLEGIVDPEQKRKIIGQQFVEVQERILASEHFLDGHWILGQGTIYPDTIESGGTAKADVIKTHHNRVAGIQELIDTNRIIEPLSLFYKDEVREIGAELGVPSEFLERHPFPGPGLAIRCLCSSEEGTAEPSDYGAVLPLRSVGVQGDSRSYRKVLVMSGGRDVARATALVNAIGEINRVVSLCAGALGSVRRAAMCATRLDRLRRVDAIVRRLSHQNGFDQQVWQFPVVLIPVGTEEQPDSVVLRPIQSTDGMTAEVVMMPESLLCRMCDELLAVEGIAAVFYDLTHKPPGTIEWE
ncbi:MAG: glutamine-hydrolyzing GMP synthase [Bryobacteraceae bacterium]|nr:glutamine-hydrolyzing GMP synthase [Bryobacteraceae bacterium]